MQQKLVNGLILSGGRSSRMDDEDKGLVLINGKPMLDYVKKTLSTQVIELFISANRNIQEYKQFGNHILTDEHNDFRGPLAGIYEGLKVIDKNSFLLVVPCDGPLLPKDLCARMLAGLAITQGDLATVFDGKYRQPTYSLIHQSLKENLKVFLDQGGRKLGQWLSENQTQLIDFSDQSTAFVNINTKQELSRIEQLLAE